MSKRQKMTDFDGTLFSELLRGICTNGREKKYVAHGPSTIYKGHPFPLSSAYSFECALPPPSKVLLLIINHDNFFNFLIFILFF